MSRRFLKKIRNFRLMSGLLIALLTILSFQNCAPAPQKCSGGDKNCTSDESKSSASGGNSSLWGSNQNGSNTGFAGGGGGSVSTGGSNTGGGGGGGISVGGGGDTTGGTGGVGDPTGGTNQLLSISTHPASVSVQEGKDFDLSVQTKGGKAPLSYKWFKDGVFMSDHPLSQHQFISDTADTYKKIGYYTVEVTDATGRTVRSDRASVNIVEPQVGCAAGSYFTFTNAQFDAISPSYFNEYFDGPRGKFLLHQSYDVAGMIYAAGSHAGLATFKPTANIPYKGTTYISCRTTIPRIHTPKPNPGRTNEHSYGSNQYADGNNYKYTGEVTFTCHNKKLLFTKNTCKWTYTPPVKSPGDR